jgi:hypothetical protein
MRNIFFISPLFIIFVASCFTGCGNSISNTPEQAVKEYFQSLNDKDCKKNINLRSANFRYKKGVDKSEELEACQEQLKVVHTLVSINIERSSIIDEGKAAEVKGKLTMSANNKEVTDEVRISLVVDADEWKLDKINYDDAPQNSTTS